MDPELLRKISPKDFYEAYLKEGLRPDNRKVDKTRNFAINLSHENNSCLVRIGNTAVICKILDGSGFEGWSDLSYLGAASGKVQIIVLVDDGNLLEAVSLSYQLLINSPEILFPFTFGEIYNYYIRDPTKEEEILCSSVFTLFVSTTKINFIKNKGSPISLIDLEKLYQTCQVSIHKALKNLDKLKSNQVFIGKLYSLKLRS
jgi:exosome complex RNA-binding protein Rrp42 (RNase PH superfamily)